MLAVYLAVPESENTPTHVDFVIILHKHIVATRIFIRFFNVIDINIADR